MSVRAIGFFFALGVFGCSSSGSNATTDAASATDSGKGDAATDALTEDVMEVPCSEPMDEWPAGSQCVKTVSGKVVDTTGAPVAKKTISVCGTICFFGETAADGTYTANVGKHIVVSNFAASVHGRPDYASLFEKLPTTPGDKITLPDMVVPKLAAPTVRVPFDAASGKIATAQSISSGDLTVSFAAGTTVELDLEDVELKAQGELFRAEKIADKDYPSFAKTAGLKLLYALTPFDSKYDQKVGVTIAATGGLAAGTPVEIVVLGDEFLKTPFTAGVPQVAATGVVTADGKIQTNAGEGISYFTWVGVREKK